MQQTWGQNRQPQQPQQQGSEFLDFNRIA